MTVQQYTSKFVELFRFSVEMNKDEKEKCRRYEWGLNRTLQSKVNHLMINDFKRLVSSVLAVLAAEEEHLGYRKDRAQERERRRNNPQPHKDGASNSGAGKKPQQQGGGFRTNPNLRPKGI